MVVRRSVAQILLTKKQGEKRWTGVPYLPPTSEHMSKHQSKKTKQRISLQDKREVSTISAKAFKSNEFPSETQPKKWLKVIEDKHLNLILLPPLREVFFSLYYRSLHCANTNTQSSVN